VKGCSDRRRGPIAGYRSRSAPRRRLRECNRIAQAAGGATAKAARSPAKPQRATTHEISLTGVARALGRIRSASRDAPALLLALALALPTAVLAQDALLDVPVRVANVPSAASVGSVTCAVFADPAGPTSNVGYLGSGSRWFALAHGGFAGRITVPVKFDAGPGRRAYRCAL
jgi:hypothetical protein